MNRDELSVLHVGLESPSRRIGGLNRYLDELSKAQRECGIDATRAWIEVQGTSDDHAVQPNVNWPKRLRSFARIIRRSDAEVIDVHFGAHAFLALVTGALRSRPLVVHFQGPWALESAVNGDGSLAVRVKSWIEGYVLRRADAVVTLSQAFRAVAIGRYHVAPQRTEVVAPGVILPVLVDRGEVRSELGIDPGDTLIVAVRRLVARTGLLEALELFAQIRRSNERLVIVGDGPQRAVLESRARELGLSGAVNFTGTVSDDELARWYRAADLSLVPSTAHEGFGLVVYESLSFGTPVIASDLDGLRDAASGCAAVRLIELNGSELRRALSDMVEPELRQEARAFAETKEWAQVSEIHRRLYERLLHEPARRGVVVLDHTARMSGGELAIVKMASALDPDRWLMHLVLAEHGPLEAELVRRGISYEVLVLDARTQSLSRDDLLARGRLGALCSTATYSLRLRRILRRRHPDIVHTNSMKAHLYGAAASILAPWALVMHVRDRWEPPYLNKNIALALRTVAWLAPDAVVANSRSTANCVSATAVVVASPTEEDFFAVANMERHDTVRLAVIGRLAPWKGQDLAIRALASVREVCPVTLSLIGDALFGEQQYVASLHELAEELGVAQWVNFVGHVDDVASQLKDIDVAILTSLSPEPFGNVVVEAMAAGRTVVVPDRGGVTEFVIQSGPLSNGLFYAMGDVDSLSSVLRRTVIDEELRRWLGKNARITAEAFRAVELAPQLEAVYESLR